MSLHEKKRQCVLKFKGSRVRYEVMANKKKLMVKKSQLKELHLKESFLLGNSMCTENHNLFYKCRQVKNAKRIYACWFFNNTINVWSSMNPIWKNCFLSMSMIYWAVPLLNLKYLFFVFLFLYILVYALGECSY